MSQPAISAAVEAEEHRVIYLAPRCCDDHEAGRLWCPDDVWPCEDCPHRHEPQPPRGVRYVLADAKEPGHD